MDSLISTTVSAPRQVGIAEVAAAQDRDAQRMQVTRSREANIYFRLLRHRQNQDGPQSLQVDAKPPLSRGTSSITPADSTPGNARNPPQHLLKEIDLLSRLGKFCPRDHCVHSQNIVGIKAFRIHTMEVLKTADHQACAHQQDEGESDLRHHQNAARAMAAGIRIGAPQPLFQRLWLTSPRLKRRAGRTPASIPVATEIATRKGEHLRIQADFQEVRKLVGQEGHDQADTQHAPK